MAIVFDDEAPPAAGKIVFDDDQSPEAIATRIASRFNEAHPASNSNDIGANPLIGGSGGVGVPITNRAVVKDIAQQRLINRNAAFGKNVQFDAAGNPIQPKVTPLTDVRAFGEGVGQTASAGLTDAVAGRVASSDFNAENQPRNIDPYAFALGQTVGGFLPIGPAAKEAQAAEEGIKNLMKQGAKIGVAYGGASGLAESIKDKNASVADYAKNILGHGVIGGAIGALVPGAVGVVRGTARYLGPPTMEALKRLSESMDAEWIKSGMTALNPRLSKVPYKEAQRALENVAPEVHVMQEKFGMPIKSAQDMADLSAAAKSHIWQEYEDQLGASNARISTDVFVKPMEKVASNFPTRLGGHADEAASDINRINNTIDLWREHPDISVKDAENIIQINNAKLKAYYAKTATDKSSAEKSDASMRALKEGTDALRSKMDTMLEGSGALKKRYGAWKVIGDLAESQAMRQSRLEGQTGLYEGLPLLGAFTDGPVGLARLGVGKIMRQGQMPDTKFQWFMQALKDEMARRAKNAPAASLPNIQASNIPQP